MLVSFFYEKESVPSYVINVEANCLLYGVIETVLMLCIASIRCFVVCFAPNGLGAEK